MANYLCTVSNKFPENYDIGVKANRWGVVEKYKNRIDQVKPGDTLVFLVGGEFRSIHRIESYPFREATPLWPSMNGSVFPYRIKISDPLLTGDRPVRELVHLISFMKDKEGWGGTIQGASGVFNSRLTDADVEIIKRGMREAPRPKAPTPPKGGPSAPFVPPAPVDPGISERQAALFKFYEKDVEDHIAQILPRLGLSIYRDPGNGRNGRQFHTEAGRIDLLCKDSAGRFVVMELKKGEAPEQTLLQILRYMSWTRQNLASGKDVRGIIFTEAADKTLVEIVKEVQNVEIQYYRVAIELV